MISDALKMAIIKHDRTAEECDRKQGKRGGVTSSKGTQPAVRAERRHTPLCVQAANESRIHMVAAAPVQAYRVGCKCTVYYQIIAGFQLTAGSPLNAGCRCIFFINNRQFQINAESNFFFFWVEEKDVATDTAHFPSPFSHIILVFCQLVSHWWSPWLRCSKKIKSTTWNSNCLS